MIAKSNEGGAPPRAPEDTSDFLRRFVRTFGDVAPDELPLMVAEDPSVLTQFVNAARAILAAQAG